jgi:glutamate carboxypeptidase
MKMDEPYSLNKKELLKRLVTISSESGNLRGITKLHKIIKAELEKFADFEFEEQIHESGNIMLVAKSANGKEEPAKDAQRILLLGHLDTIFPYNKDENPFREEDGKIYGSGTQDMKGGIVVMMKIVEKLKQKFPNAQVDLCFTPDEETPNYYFQDHIEKLAKNYTHAFVYECSLNSAEYASNKFSIVTKRKGILNFKVILKGPGGHAGVITDPKKRHSTISLAAKMIKFIDHLTDPATGTTVHTGFIEGGIAKNVLAPETKLTCEARISDGEEITRMKSQIDSYIASISTGETPFKVKVNYTRELPPLTDSSEVKKLAGKAEKVAQQMNLDYHEEYRSGWSEACFLQQGNPKLAVIDGLGAIGKGEHTQDEFIYAESLELATEFSYELISSILKD